MFDLLLKGARVVDPVNNVDRVADVAVEGGKIAAVGAGLAGEARETVDLTGLVLTPGVIDPHLHLGAEFGSPYGQRMTALSGVTTCLDMAGPVRSIIEDTRSYGCGINVAMLEGFSPMRQFGTEAPTSEQMGKWIDESLDAGAIGVKIMGGHWPVALETELELVRLAPQHHSYVAWHAGSSTAGSNIKGVREVVNGIGDLPLHLAHINAYCRGRVNPVVDEAEEALKLLREHPNIWCESYISPLNGTILACDEKDGHCTDHVTCNCLRTYGFSEDMKGIEGAILAGKLFVIRDNGTVSELLEGQTALEHWKSKGTKTAGSFPVNPAASRFLIATAKREDGSFVVDSLCTDGGCIPRNVIIPMGLSLVRFGALTLSEFVVKASVNAARHLRLVNKGHLSEGADADITVFDFDRQQAVYTWVAGRRVLDHGKLLQKGANFITSERGRAAVEKAGFTSTVVSFDTPEPARFIAK
ncbi:MAG: amidohydrolase family protein [Mesosutterella sp.]|nr:amidohydrolase family protein [Mesosutterella sp.]